MAPHVDRMGNFDDKDINLLKTKGFTDEQIMQMTKEELTSAINTVKQSGANPEELPPDNSEAQFNKEQAKQVGFFGATIAFVGGVVGYFAGGRNAKAAAKGAALGATAGALIGGMTSCDKNSGLGGTFIMNNTTNYNETINIINDVSEIVANQIQLHQDNEELKQLLMQISSLLAQLSVNINENHVQTTQNMNLIIRLLGQIIGNQEMQHTSMIEYLTQILDKLDEMDANQQANSLAILQQLQNMQQTDNEHFQQLMAKLDELKALGVDMMAVIQAFHNDFNGAIETLTSLINELTAIAQNNNETLQQILAKINQMDTHMQQGFWQLLNQLQLNGGSLEEIQAQLAAILNAINNMDASNTALLQEILGGVNNLNATIQTGVAQILAAIDGLSATFQAGILQILAKLDQMDEHQQASVLQMLQHMIQIENNQNQQSGQMQTIINLIHQLQNGQNVTQQSLDAILAAINNLNGNVTEQGNALALLLTQILGKLDSIDNKVGAIKATATSILNVVQHMDGDNHIIIGLLNQIIANQGNNYNDDCLECCQQVVILLEQIVAYIINGDTNNEGFDGSEYDDLFS